MKNCLLVLWCCCSSLFVFSQGSSQGDLLFSNYEYALAASSYESQGSNGLSPVQTENLLVCYYVLLNDEKGLPLVNQLLNKNESNLNYWLFKSRFEKEGGNFAAATKSANRYLELGGKNLPAGYLNSCKFQERYMRKIAGELTNNSNNTTKANFITRTANKTLFFKEIGVDSVRKISNSNAWEEAFLLRPFTDVNGALVEWKLLPEDDLLSIQSLQIDLASNTVYFSATRPAGNKATDVNSKIYKADFNGFDAPLSNVGIFKSAGIVENDIVGQVALSPNGELLVFSKLDRSKGTSDLFLSKKSGGSWSQANAIGFLNTSGEEAFPLFLNDSTFCFSSDGRLGNGDLDIFQVKVTDQFSKEESLYQFLSPLNSTADDFLWTHDGKELSTFCSNRKSTVGDDDVWAVSSTDLLVRYAGKIAGDKDYDGFIDGDEIAGDIDEDGIINNGEIAGDINGDRIINEGEIAGDVNANMVIEGNEIAGDVDGNYKIDLDKGEITGDVNGNKTIDDGEIAGDVSGNKIIDNGEIAGDVNGNKIIDDGEIAGDVNGNKIIDDGEIAGDTSGNKIIDGNEIAGDVNGNGIIDDGEIAGDVNGNKIIDSDELTGDINGNGKIDSDEVLGDANGNRILDHWEIGEDIEALLRLWSKEHILYEFNISATREQFSYLERLKGFLDQGYQFDIESVGHTDSRGLSEYNYKLGLKRAKEAKAILVKMGFPASDIKVTSVGEEELENDCYDGVDCTEEEHKVNRFVNLNLSLKKVGKPTL